MSRYCTLASVGHHARSGVTIESMAISNAGDFQGRRPSDRIRAGLIDVDTSVRYATALEVLDDYAALVVVALDAPATVNPTPAYLRGGSGFLHFGSA